MDDKLKEIPSQVLCLDAKRIEYGRCRHINVLINPDLEYVTCKACGEKLNPMMVLNRMASEETRWEWLRKEQQEWDKKYKERVRVKCQHCKKMTPLNVKSQTI